ncbi:MAG: hypothetical protein JWQ71_2462 [Pedosphaera sp.]|nr:hypothetical protein [Pedosphaera sp.]
MRLFEILLLLINVPALGWSMLSRWPKPKWLLFFSFLAIPFFILHLCLEKSRWQMTPAYLVIVILLIVHFKLLTRSTINGFKSWRMILVDLVGLALLVCAAMLSFVFPVFKFPAPTGPYLVGTVTLHLTDNSRSETFSKNPKDRRELMVQLWYPVEPSCHGKPEHYLANLGDAEAARRQAYGLRFSQLNLVETHSIPDAALSPQQPDYPILIFSPSWGGSRNQNTYQAEELASHGFIVAGIDHTYCTGVTVMPGGRIIFSGPELDVDFSSDEGVQRYLHIAPIQARLRAQDAIFVLNQLAELNVHDVTGRFIHRLDLKRVGIFGHSFGGTVAAEACLLDNRFKAGMNMDGMIFGDAVEQRVKQPFLFMSSDEVRPSAEEIAHSSYAKLDDRSFKVQDAFFRLNGGYNLIIKKAKHSNFSDTALFSPLSRFTDAGTISAYRCARIVDDYTLAFFEKYLNKAPSPLFDLPSQSYSEITLEKYGK